MDAEFLKYQYEDGYDGVVVKNRFKVGVRHLQMVYMFACALVLGAVRGSAGVAVLAMSDVTRRNDTYIQIHEWDRRIQGKILSSFFFGYALMLIPAELYLRKVSGKLVLTAVLLINGALSVAMPTIANRGGWVAVYNAQLWLGMTQACLSPANQSLLVKWLPPNERSVFSCFIHAGVHLGIIIALPISGMLSEAHLGWELVYYSQAMMTLSMAAIWVLLTASTPEQHQAVGDTEKEYIKEALSCYRKKVMHVPWRSILKSKEFWGIACAHAASNAVFVFFLSDVPAFMLTFGTSLRVSSWQSMLPFAALWLVNVTTAPTVEWVCRLLHAGFYFNVTFFRKLVNAFGAFGVIVGLTVLPYLVPDWNHLALVVLTGTLGLLGFQFSGFLENHRDMSQNYPETLLRMTSRIAAAAGALVPFLSGLVVGDDMMDVKRWRVVFLSLASLYVVCTVVYCALASSERQPWDGGAVVKPKFGYHNGVIDTNQLELEDLSNSQKHCGET